MTTMVEQVEKPNGNGQRDDVAIREAGDGLWMISTRGPLDERASRAIRDASIRALDCGATNLVVDISACSTVGPDTADVLLSVAESLRARGGLLWLASCVEPERFRLLPLDDEGMSAIERISVALEDVRSSKEVA